MSGNVLKATLLATARFRDLLSRPAKPALATLNRFSQFSRSMNFGNQFARQSRKFTRAANSASLSVSAPLGIMARFGAQAVYDQEKAMNKAESLGAHVSGFRNEAAKSLGKKENLRALLADKVSALNSEFTYTNTEITNAANELFKAGFKFDQVMGSLRDTLNLGLAGDIDLKNAADIATNVMTAMRLPMDTQKQSADSLRKVVDNLAFAATNSNTDIRLLGLTFKYVGSMAAAAGMSIEEVSAMSQAMANNGVKGSEAGVAMRASLVRMIKMTKDGYTELNKLGVNLDDFKKGKRAITSDDILVGLSSSGLKTEGLKPIIDKLLSDKELAGNTGKLSAAMTTALAGALGDDSTMGSQELKKTMDEILITAGTKLDLLGFIKAIKENSKDPLASLTKIFNAKHVARLAGVLNTDFKKLLDEIEANAKGTGTRMAKTMMKGVVGAVGRLGAAWNNLWVQGSEKSGIKVAAIGFMDTLTALLNKIKNLSPQTLKLSAYFLGFLAVVGPLGLALTGVAAVFGMLGAAIAILSGPIGWLVGAVVLIGRLFGVTGDDVIAFGQKVFSIMGTVADVIAKLGQMVWQFLPKLGSMIGEWFSSLGSGLADFFSNFGTQLKTALLSPFKELMKLGSQFSGLFTEEQKQMMVAVFEAPGAALDAFIAKIKQGVTWVKNLYTKAKSLLSFSGSSSGGGSSSPKLTPRASGGPVSSGSSYLVGEQGPELFTPKRGGHIVPNNALGGRSVTIGDIHVHVNGAAAGGDPGQLAHMLGVQVTRALDEYLSDGGQ